MKATLSRYSTKLDEVTDSIKKALLAANNGGSALGTSDLVKVLEEKRGSLASILKYDEQQGDKRITERVINNFYAGVLSDLYRVTAIASEAATLIESHKQASVSRLHKVKTVIESQTSQLRELRFLRDNIDYLESFDQMLGDNHNESYLDSVVYNDKNATVGLPTYSSADVADGTVSVTILGDPDRSVLPSYDASKVFDKSVMSAWFEVVGYKTKPSNWLALESSATRAQLVGTIESNVTPPSAGTNKIKIEVGTLFVGEWLSIGTPSYSNYESVQVLSINTLLREVTFASSLQYNHYVNEEVYKGKNLIQSEGSVAIVDIKFTYPQQPNFMKLTPFTSSPINVLGMFIPSGDPFLPWKIVPNTSVSPLSSASSRTFNKTVSTSYRFIIEQPIGTLMTRNLSSVNSVSNLSWDAIYEEEFNTKTDSLNNQLSHLSSGEILSASSGDNDRAFAVRKGALATILSEGANGSDTASRIATQLDSVDKFAGGVASTNVTRQTRYTYELGLAEIELYSNNYIPLARYSGKVINPKQDASIYSVTAEHDTPNNTSIQHSLRIETGEILPIPNLNDVSSTGLVVSKDEMINIDPETRKGILRFDPYASTVNVSIQKAAGEFSSIRLDVNDGRVIELSTTSYNQKWTYSSTYPVKESKVYLLGSVPSKNTVETYKGTDSKGFIKLQQNPYIDLGIANDVIRWVKDSKLQARWALQVGDTVSYVSGNEMFPTHGVVSNNSVYYGYKGEEAINRTSDLDGWLYTFFSNYSGDSKVLIDRFYNKYNGKVLETNLVYEPLIVKVNGVVANNLTNYSGGPDTGFISGIPLDNQFHHFSNRLKFAKEIPDTVDIEVTYDFKATTIQLVSDLMLNKKSNFHATPILKNVLVSTMG